MVTLSGDDWVVESTSSDSESESSSYGGGAVSGVGCCCWRWIGWRALSTRSFWVSWAMGSMVVSVVVVAMVVKVMMDVIYRRRTETMCFLFRGVGRSS